MQPNQAVPSNFLDFTEDYIVSLAESNNYSYTKESRDTSPESSLYNNPRTNTRKMHKLDMIIDNLACEYYTAEYLPMTFEAGTGGALAEVASSAAFQIQIFSVTLPYIIEDLYVESRTNATLNNVLGLSSVVFRETTRIKLEGNFNRYFRVYVPNNEELNAFTILAPNIMMRLLETGSNYDFEFSNNKVYFYQIFPYFTPGKITFKKTAYDALLSFGIDSAKAMARASRPTERSLDSHNAPMWQHYGTSNAKLFATIGVIMFTVFFLVLCLLIPLLWPLAIIFIIFFAIRYRVFTSKKKRLIADFQAKR